MPARRRRKAQLEMNTSAQFEIIVDGTPRSYRDDKGIAIDAGKQLKETHRSSDVRVRDMRDNSVVVIGWESGKVFVKT
jgi:hypothetical protein